MNLKRCITILALLCISAIPLKAQNIDFLSSSLWSGCGEVKIGGDYAYCAYKDGLLIVNISDPINPFYQGQLYLPGLNAEIQGPFIDISGDYAYLLYQYLYVVDISNPSSPYQVGRYDPQLAYHGNDIVVSGNYAYISLFFQPRFLVVDVSDPTNPAYAGSCYVATRPEGVAVSGNHAYVACDGFLDIVNIDNPVNPTVVGSYNTQARLHRIFIVDTLAYIADGGGISIFDISIPTDPSPIGNCEITHARDICVMGSYAYLAARVEPYQGGIQVVDISDPAHPFLAGHLNTPDWQYYQLHVSCGNGKIFAPLGPFGLRIIDAADPYNPVSVGEYQTDFVYDISVAGNYLYAANGIRGLKVLNISDPSNITEVGSCPLVAESKRVTTANGFAYMPLLDSSLKIIDLANPENPSVIGSFEGLGYINAIKVSGSYAYASSDAGLGIINMEDHSNPTLVSLYSDFGPIGDLFVFGNYVYLVENTFHNIQIINIVNPLSPVWAGSYISPIPEHGYLSKICIDGNYAYFAMIVYYDWNVYQYFLEIADISNPANPSYLCRFLQEREINDIVINDNYAYLAIGSFGRGSLTIFNIEDPANPILAGSFSRNALSVNVNNNDIFISTGNSVLALQLNPTFVIENMPLPSNSFLYQNYPNPFNAFTVVLPI